MFQPAVRGSRLWSGTVGAPVRVTSGNIVVALADQDIEVDQIHPEYGPGQFEISVAAADPVAAADDYVLVRETIRARQRPAGGMRVSFSPKVIVNHVGQWRSRAPEPVAGRHEPVRRRRWPVRADGGGRGRFAAGILERLPALLAVGAPSVASYLRLIPQHWAGRVRRVGAWRNRGDRAAPW